MHILLILAIWTFIFFCLVAVLINSISYFRFSKRQLNTTITFLVAGLMMLALIVFAFAFTINPGAFKLRSADVFLFVIMPGGAIIQTILSWAMPDSIFKRHGWLKFIITGVATILCVTAVIGIYTDM
ncbi:MAG: hypothetical protein M3Z08_09105 [Chloroflexota bacterium]|nr:hypothetical protein [Chloroflexota bacterium]